MLCELCLKICFKICCLWGDQQQAAWPGKPRWHHFRERDCKMLKHSLQDVWKENFPLKIHSSPETRTWKSIHPSLWKLTGLELMPWMVLTFLFPQKWITAMQTKEKLYFLLVLSLKKNHKASLGSNVLYSGKHHRLPTVEGKSKVQNGARMSTTDVLCHSSSRPRGLLKQEIQESPRSGLQYYSLHQLLRTTSAIVC